MQTRTHSTLVANYQHTFDLHNLITNKAMKQETGAAVIICINIVNVIMQIIITLYTD